MKGEEKRSHHSWWWRPKWLCLWVRRNPTCRGTSEVFNKFYIFPPSWSMYIDLYLTSRSKYCLWFWKVFIRPSMCTRLLWRSISTQNSCELRAYPSGLGDSIHKVYVDELKRPVHGDLRVLPEKLALPFKTELQLFMELPMGDLWSDAKLLPVFEYIYLCKHTRTQVFFRVGWIEST